MVRLSDNRVTPSLKVTAYNKKMKFLFDGPIAILAIFLGNICGKFPSPYRCSAPTATTSAPAAWRVICPARRGFADASHIVQRLTERIGQRYIIILRRAFSHQLIICCSNRALVCQWSAYRPAAPVLCQGAGATWQSVFSPFQFNHGFMLLLSRLQCW